MRFVTFEYGGQARAGALTISTDPSVPTSVIDGAHPNRPDPLQGLKPDLISWIEADLVALSQALKTAALDPACLIPLDKVRLLAPLPQPGKIVGAAFNYHDALEALGRPVPESPVLFVKSRSTVIGPDEAIRLLPGHDVTYEAELAAVIGTTVLRATGDTAMSHVCGYTIFNDVSYTNMVKQDGGFIRGKNQPTSGPLGPWIVSADDIVDPHDLMIELEINGIQLQYGSTGQMAFKIPELIVAASADLPLDPGDIIATGTPAGVAANHKPPTWLSHDQRISIRIAQIGELVNPVIEEST